ncbi:MAG: ABC transporter ATP-binding protein [Acidobacteriota bacterium]
MSRARPSTSAVLRFLGPYFKPYLPQVGSALVAAFVYSLCSVLTLAVFQVVLADVVKTDTTLGEAMTEGALADVTDAADSDPTEDEVVADADTEAGDEAAADEDDGADGSGPMAWLRRLDLNAIILSSYTAVRDALGIDDDGVVYFVPLLLIVVVTLRSLARFANGYLFQRIGLGATNDLRNDLYHRILLQSSRFYARHPSGELVSRVSNDISVLQNAVSTRFVDFFQQVPTFIGIIWYLISLHLKLSMIVFLVVPAIAVPIVRFGRGMRKTSHQSQERLADLSNLVAEAVRGHRVVKAFGMEGFELGRFRTATARHLRVKLRAQLLAFASGPVIETLAVIGAGAFLVYAGLAVRANELTPSTLVTFLVATLALYDPIRKLNKVNLVFQESIAAAERVRDIMLEERDVREADDAALLAPIEHEMHFDGVDFSYDADTPVLRGVDLRVRRGEVVALVGHSGAGKSTLVNLLPRFFDPTGGAVRIDGVDVRDGTLASLREQIGIVTQDTMLFNDTVAHNIAYGRSDVDQDRLVAAAEAAYAHDFVLDMADGYDTQVGESGSNLSGGQRQRLAIARALFKDPPILILDEATSHLDAEAEALVQKALARLMEGRTALVIAHRLSTVQRADRIVVLDAGEIVEEGTHAELLERGGTYHRLYELQFRDPVDVDSST